MNREELAWAAGFFDGEGGTYIYRSRRLTLTISQIHPEVLHRFKDAIGGLGFFGGPYVKRTQPTAQPWWQFRTSRFEHVQAIIAMLWPFLSSVKREQAKRCLGELK